MATTAAIPSIMGTMTDDPSSLLAKEWLVTNGIGGYASSSLLGHRHAALSRRVCAGPAWARPYAAHPASRRHRRMG